MKINDTVKGIFVGVFACGLLEVGAVFLLAFFNNNNIIDFGGIDGLVVCLVAFGIILVFTTLLGVAIARRAKLLKKVTISFTIIIVILLTSGFIYSLLYTSSQPLPTFPPDTI